MDISNYRYLLIEDDQMIRELYLSEFEHVGLQIVGAANGAEGFKKLNGEHFDVLLLDIMLPDTNGLAILQKIKQDPRLQKIRVIMLTNLGGDLTLTDALKYGAEGYLVKANFNPEQMIDQVKKILNEYSDNVPQQS